MAAEEEVNTWQARDYQIQAHDAVFREFTNNHRSTLLVLPTGTGKTYIAAKIAQTAINLQPKPVLFLAHREILITQAAETLEDVGLYTAIEMGGQNAQIYETVLGQAACVVGTVQTLKGARLARWSHDHFGLIITDECHRAAAETHQLIYRWFQSAWHLGITATPDGSSGEIGNVFETIAYTYPIRDAVTEGWLVPPRYELCKLKIDLRGIRTTTGDFNVRELAERISPSISLLADAIKQRIGTRFSVVFTPDVGSALSLAAALGNDSPSGGPVSARYVSGDSGRFGMSRRERKDHLSQFADQKLQVLVCCDLLFEGWDARHLSAVVIARPTRLRYRYAQMVGRGLRICPEMAKTDCVIVDFDWQCDPGSRDIVTPIAILAADDPDLKRFSPAERENIVKTANKLLRTMTNPMEAIEQAKELERHRRATPVYLTGMKAQFEIEHYDPLAVGDLCGIRLQKRFDFVRPGFERAYPAQIKALKAYGVIDADKLSLFGASKLLRELDKRTKKGLSSYTDIHRLIKAGFTELEARTMTATQAKIAIDNLK